MKCKNCGAENNWAVIDTRDSGNMIRRRRKCQMCGQRITTYEIIQTEIEKAENPCVKKAVVRTLNEILNKLQNDGGWL